MRFKKAPKRIVELNLNEVKLLRFSLIRFGNKCVYAGKPTVDIDDLIIRVSK